MSSKVKPYRVGICGCGSSVDLYKGIHHRHASFKLVSTADLHIERAEKAARQWEGVNAYGNATQMLDREKPDLLIIATPPANHLELALEAASRGIHLLIQKPIACTVAEAEQIIDCCRTNHCGLKVSFARRYYPAFQKAYEQINTLGRNLLLRCTWNSTSGWKDRPNKQWKKSRETRGGVLVDLGSHVIDLARWWMGEAIGCRLAMSIVKGELDNIAEFIMNHDNGSITRGSLSNVAYIGKESYEYIGSDGGLRLECTGGSYPGSWRLTRYRHDAPPKHWSFNSNATPANPGPNPFILEMVDFISQLQKDPDLMDQSSMGYKALVLTSLLYQSSTVKDKMDLDDFSIDKFFELK